MNPDTTFLSLNRTPITSSQFIGNQPTSKTTALLEKKIHLPEDITHSSTPQFFDEDRLLGYLIKKGLTNSHGVAVNDPASLTRLLLSALCPAGHDKLEGILLLEKFLLN